MTISCNSLFTKHKIRGTIGIYNIHLDSDVVWEVPGEREGGDKITLIFSIDKKNIPRVPNVTYRVLSRPHCNTEKYSRIKTVEERISSLIEVS